MSPINRSAQPNGIVSLKGETEAEALSQYEIAREFAYALKNNIGYILKIGGAEAKSDIMFAKRLGITQIVAPMVETPFAMSKYMGAIPPDSFDHVGVTIETTTAVNNIEAILDAGPKLTHVTVGRSDLTRSYQGSDVDSEATMKMVQTVVNAARARDLYVTLGGGVNTNTRKALLESPSLAEKIGWVETRKAVIPMNVFLGDDNALRMALSIERDFLDSQAQEAKHVVEGSEDRRQRLVARLG